MTQGDLRRIYGVYKSLPNALKKGDLERVIVELVRRLNAAGDPQLMRKIRNFVRSLLMPDRKVSVSLRIQMKYFSTFVLVCIYAIHVCQQQQHLLTHTLTSYRGSLYTSQVN